MFSGLGFSCEKKTKYFVKVSQGKWSNLPKIKKLNKLNTYPKFPHIFGPIRIGFQISHNFGDFEDILEGPGWGDSEVTRSVTLSYIILKKYDKGFDDIWWEILVLWPATFSIEYKCYW